MAIKRNKRFHAEVATSSLSDIMFFLLLFFLIISTLANPNVIKLLLPKAENNEKTNKQLITITVSDDKKYFIDKEEVPFSELEKQIMTRVGKANETTVVVRVSAESQVQELVDVLQIGVKNHLKFVLATATP
jgi:biopolymer transport protein ExbD